MNKECKKIVIKSLKKFKPNYSWIVEEYKKDLKIYEQEIIIAKKNIDYFSKMEQMEGSINIWTNYKKQIEKKIEITKKFINKHS